MNSHGRIMEHFKEELIDYPDYYNNRRIKAKLKGLPPAVHRQQALSAALNHFCFEILSDFRCSGENTKAY